MSTQKEMRIKKLVIDKLKELYTVACSQNLKSKHNYNKIKANVENLEADFKTPDEIRELKYVGTKTYKQLISYIGDTLFKEINNYDDLVKYKAFIGSAEYEILKERFTGGKRLSMQDINNSLLKMDDIEIKNILDKNSTSKCDIEIISSPLPKKFMTAGSGEKEQALFRDLTSKITDVTSSLLLSIENTKDGATKSRNNKKEKVYTPKYRSSAYAILKALYQEDGISRHRIAHIASKYCDTDFDFTSRVSAWSGITTLKRKNLVYKETGSKKYYLTDSGKELSSSMFKDSSFINTDDTIKLVVDAREMRNRKCRMYFQDYFMTAGVPHETRNLEVGDFIWVQNDAVCDTIVERKKGSDFASSITDGRYKEQKRRLLGMGIRNVVYIIENLTKADFSKIGFEYGMYNLTSIKMDGLTVIETCDIKSTAKVLKKIDEGIRLRTPTFGTEMSYSSYAEKGCKDALKCCSLLYYTFCAISGISHKKAEFLSKQFKTLKSFYRVVESHDIQKYLSNLIFEGKSLPKKNIEDIIELLCK